MLEAEREHALHERRLQAQRCAVDTGKPSSLAAVQAVLDYKGPAVSVDDMRVTDYKG